MGPSKHVWPLFAKTMFGSVWALSMSLCQLPNLDSQDDDVCELQNYQNVIVSGSGHCEIKSHFKKAGFRFPTPSPSSQCWKTKSWPHVLRTDGSLFRNCIRTSKYTFNFDKSGGGVGNRFGPYMQMALYFAMTGTRNYDIFTILQLVNMHCQDQPQKCKLMHVISA